MLSGEPLTSRYPPVALPDSSLARSLREFCLGLDGAWEDYPWGDIVFKVGPKMFAATGPELPVQVTVKAAKEDAELLVQHADIERARYVGQHGWITVTIETDETWQLAKELIAASYQMVAPKRRRVTSSR